MAAGTALIEAMAGDAWQQARTAMVGLWRRAHPHHASVIETDLEGLRRQVLDARQAGRTDTEHALTGIWQGRLQQLLLDDPGLANDLRRVLDEALTPALGLTNRTHVGHVFMSGSSHDSSTFNQVAGDQHNHHRR